MFERMQAKDVRVGDRVANYIVTDVEDTAIGMVRHQHDGGSTAYWPHEWLRVRRPVTVIIHNPPLGGGGDDPPRGSAAWYAGD